MNTIVLLSGGQDSTTALAWALREWGPARTVAFDYGQRHRVELEQSAIISKELGAESHVVLPVEALKVLGGAALTNDNIKVEAEASEYSLNSHAWAHGLPSTFVPGRNMLFLTLAAAYGAKFGIYDLVTGVCGQDRAGYPDCRAEFIRSAEATLSLALDEPVSITAPLVDQTKAQTWALADDLGILDVIIEHTHTCYFGNRNVRHDWGYGCGECPACIERIKGWDQFSSDKLDFPLEKA
jgi:7-cyano-7-deazaguanine synthase